ncbi:MAG: RimK family alpha-L-glutamate ligase [Sulfuricella sp.]|nr:RimK family alpha-L-glutamate ligase [Sulfuricella sp.]
MTDFEVPRAPEYLGLAALLRLSLAGENLTPLCQSLLDNAGRNPNDACSLMDAAVIFQFHGNPEIALQLQQEALRLQRLYRIPARLPARLRLLALMAPGEIMANVPVECLLENSDTELDIFYATGVDDDLSKIPDHDVLFVAIGESEANRPILESWLPVLAEWPRPVINNPFHMERVARDSASRLLQSLPGIAMPPTLRSGREELQRAAAGSGFPDGIGFPVIVRPLDSHAGHDLYKIDTPAELSDKLAVMPGDEFFVSPFIDYRSGDGLFRKYRVILIDGRPFACHMAISSHWMIHYLNAGMAESADKRAEEARFMADFDQDFAVRQGAALSEIHRRIGLDYLGIDCAETADGRLLIFEVDPAMVVHAMDPADVYPYKQAAMQKLFAAFRAMLAKAAERQPASR